MQGSGFNPRIPSTCRARKNFPACENIRPRQHKTPRGQPWDVVQALQCTSKAPMQIIGPGHPGPLQPYSHTFADNPLDFVHFHAGLIVSDDGASIRLCYVRYPKCSGRFNLAFMHTCARKPLHHYQYQTSNIPSGKPYNSRINTNDIENDRR